MSTTPHSTRDQLDLFGHEQRIDATRTKRRTRALEKPISISVNEALVRYGIGRTKLYELLGDGSLKAKKLGAKTLIDVASADVFFKSLPDYNR